MGAKTFFHRKCLRKLQHIHLNRDSWGRSSRAMWTVQECQSQWGRLKHHEHCFWWPNFQHPSSIFSILVQKPYNQNTHPHTFQPPAGFTFVRFHSNWRGLTSFAKIVAHEQHLKKNTLKSQFLCTYGTELAQLLNLRVYICFPLTVQVSSQSDN